MLYDVPGRTGQPIALPTYEAALRLDTVSSVKHATGNPLDTIALRELGYDVYSGDDARAPRLPRPRCLRPRSPWSGTRPGSSSGR